MKKFFIAFLLIVLFIYYYKLENNSIKYNEETSQENNIIQEKIDTWVVLEEDEINKSKEKNEINKSKEANNIQEKEDIKLDKDKKIKKSDLTCEKVWISSIYWSYNFPAPIKMDLTFENTNPKCPYEENRRRIFISYKSLLYKDSVQFIWEDSFTLTWFILNDVEKIEIIWDWDMDSFFLNKYKPWDNEFIYNISSKLWNLKTWMNRYLIRWYSKKWIYEELFNLLYFDYNDSYILKEVESVIFHWDSKIKPSFWFVKEKNNYLLWMYYWTYRLNLEKYDIFFSNNIDSNKSFIKIINKINWEEYIDNNYKWFISDDSSVPKVEVLDNWNFIFSLGWHESATQEIFFNSNTKKFYDIFDLIKYNTDTLNFYHSIKIEDEFFYINSSKNPWSEWSYSLKFDINTMNLIN